MGHYRKWKKAGVLILTAAAVGSVSLLPEGGLLTVRAAEASPVTEYDEETLEKFQDDVLEYWEIPGLIERYNTTYLNQLEKYYYNPDSTLGLTRDQLLSIAAELREEAKNLEDTAEDDKDEITKEEYEEYRANVRVLRARAKDLEDSANGKSAAGTASKRALRILKNNQTIAARQLMRDYQTLKAQSEIADNALEIAELNYEAAKRQSELGIYAAEDLLSAEDALNTANANASSARKAYVSGKQDLIKMLGWRYDADPVIMKVPEPDVAKIAEYNPDVDIASAIDHNITLYDTKLTSPSSQGGMNKKARTVKDQEDEVRANLPLLYKEVQQKQAAYEAAKLKYTTDEANKAMADRKNALGMLSKQEYLSAENTWLTAQADYESAGLSLTAAMEEYEWAVQGMMELSSASSGS